MSKNPNKSRVFNGPRTVTRKKGVTPSGKAYDTTRIKEHTTGEVHKNTVVDRPGGIRRKSTVSIGQGDSLVKRSSDKTGKIGDQKYRVHKTSSETRLGGVNYPDGTTKATYVGKKGRTKKRV